MSCPQSAPVALNLAMYCETYRPCKFSDIIDHRGRHQVTVVKVCTRWRHTVCMQRACGLAVCLELLMREILENSRRTVRFVLSIPLCRRVTPRSAKSELRTFRPPCIWLCRTHSVEQTPSEYARQQQSSTI